MFSLTLWKLPNPILSGQTFILLNSYLFVVVRVFVCVCVCRYVHASATVFGIQKGMSNLLKLDVDVVVNHLTWALGRELSLSASVCAFNH